MRKKVIVGSVVALLSWGLFYFVTHLSFQDPYRVSPILYGATMTAAEMQADPLKANSMTREATRELYKLMADITSLFEQQGIEYWITCGTLLGAVRHQGVIPYDDDVDVCFWQKDLDKVKALKPQLQKIGYDMYQDRASLKIYKTDGVPLRPKRSSFKIADGLWFVRHKRERFPCMDLYASEKRGPVIHYHLAKARELFPKKFYQDGEIYPLKKYTFGPLTVWGPQKPEGLLQRSYGHDATTRLVFEGHHSPSTKQKFYLPLTAGLSRKLQKYQGF